MKRIISIVVLGLLFFVSPLIILASEDEPISSATSGTAYYEANSLVERNQLKAGVVHEKYVAHISNTLTGFSAAGSGGGGENVSGQLYPESVNFLSIPRGSNAKIVNWANSGAYFSSWKKGTVESMALDFEANNPGWKVIAAVNADFFDINGHQPLMQAPSGASMVNGEVYKPTTGRAAVGFTNQAEGETLVGNEPITFSSEYYLRIFDEDGAIVSEFASDAVNPTNPIDGLNIYHSYYYFPAGMTYEDNVREYYSCHLPANGYVVSGKNVLQEVCYSATAYYGAGLCEKTTNNDTVIQPGCFGLYTNNETILSLLQNYHHISITRKATGAFSECDNISGCGDTLVFDGAGCIYNNKERHPRTIVGVKADGTVVLCTVDGRQPNKDMYGMTLDELSATLLAYGCVEGYNLDGGGSTTMIIREGKKFRTLNSPSDGSPRNDANAILVVVQDIDLDVTQVTDTTCTIKAPNNIPGTQIDNIVVHLDDKNYSLVDELLIKGLNTHQNYQITYEYDRTYRGITQHVNGEPFTIKTGYRIPELLEFLIQENSTGITASFKFDDPDQVIEDVKLYYTKGSKVVQGNSITLEIENYQYNDFALVVFYTLDSSTTHSGVLEFKEPRFEAMSHPDGKKDKGCFNKTGFILPLLMGASIIALYFMRKKQ